MINYELAVCYHVRENPGISSLHIVEHIQSTCKLSPGETLRVVSTLVKKHCLHEEIVSDKPRVYKYTWVRNP